MIDKPGPELDERISVLLFNTAVTDYYSQVGPYAIASKESSKSYYMDYPNGPEIPVVPDYSTTWNGMQLVVEEMQRRGFQILFTTIVGGKWKAVVFNGYTRGHVYAEGFGDTAPHATALSALKALEDKQ